MNLREKIHSRQALVGVIGLGYVGLPLVLRFCEAGFPVLGFDTDPAKVEKLNRGESYIRHIPSDRLARLVEGGPKGPCLAATHDMGRLGEPDILVICVPTPLTRHREPDLRYVALTSRLIAQTLRPGQLISLESTTYPGTTAELVLPILAEKGQAGRDFFLVYSPEREDPGNPHYDVKT
ncbi:MAG: nucleotide sugar dehydrogenase, partial [Deltaproteobacteria bacterium]|nr:nucleotide sugar dehydrogenase [Deltaproteobacteria bacterium]